MRKQSGWRRRSHGAGRQRPRALPVRAQATDADAQEAARARVWTAYLALVQALAAAQLEEVGAGGRYAHAAPAVLLRGSLRVRGVCASLAEGLPAGEAAPAQGAPSGVRPEPNPNSAGDGSLGACGACACTCAPPSAVRARRPCARAAHPLPPTWSPAPTTAHTSGERLLLLHLSKQRAARLREVGRPTSHCARVFCRSVGGRVRPPPYHIQHMPDPTLQTLPRARRHAGRARGGGGVCRAVHLPLGGAGGGGLRGHGAGHRLPRGRPGCGIGSPTLRGSARGLSQADENHACEDRAGRTAVCCLALVLGGCGLRS